MVNEEMSIVDLEMTNNSHLGETTNNVNNLEIKSIQQNLSKRQLKKLKKKEKWIQSKPEKRLKERKKLKEKRAFARANNIDLGPSRKGLKQRTMANSTCKINVSLDLSFDDLMIDKDVAKMIKQILRCYTLNRRADAPLQFSVTNFTGKSLQEMKKHNGYEHWDVKFHAEHYSNLFAKEKIVYLTSESDNIIENLENDATYIIGGLVDHNAQKGLSHKLANSTGVRHARLPLDKYLNMKTRKVLSIVHVFEILLKISEGKSWEETLLQVLPERKNAQPICSSPSKEETKE